MNQDSLRKVRHFLAGKLKNPLPLSMVGHPSFHTVLLQNVLVVHKFPVPFHLTVKLKPEEKNFIYANMW